MPIAAAGIVLGLGTLVMVLIVLVRREGPGDLGTVSRAWIVENRVDHHDHG